MMLTWGSDDVGKNPVYLRSSNHLGQRDEAAAQTAKPRADKEDEEGPAPARLGDDERNGPTRDLDDGAEEVAHVDVHLVHLHHVRRVLHQAVVGEGASHT